MFNVEMWNTDSFLSNMTAVCFKPVRRQNKKVKGCVFKK